eukprot:TRINITY_DN3323_c0_g3_i2.p1 TRINITY_DN3323_c0_g3~~TRINITY_DN3323_c0_g3_i2.p1  ORF type:complete len:112 (+),score=1.64 TRINITY_DN3323_c0_g3_i2:332-667(+)
MTVKINITFFIENLSNAQPNIGAVTKEDKEKAERTIPKKKVDVLVRWGKRHHKRKHRWYYNPIIDSLQGHTKTNCNPRQRLCFVTFANHSLLLLSTLTLVVVLCVSPRTLR